MKMLDFLRTCLISSASILIHVKMIETCVESVLPRIRTIRNSGSFLLFW
jgi:hypothetical protein